MFGCRRSWLCAHWLVWLLGRCRRQSGEMAYAVAQLQVGQVGGRGRGLHQCVELLKAQSSVAAAGVPYLVAVLTSAMYSCLGSCGRCPLGSGVESDVFFIITYIFFRHTSSDAPACYAHVGAPNTAGLSLGSGCQTLHSMHPTQNLTSSREHVAQQGERCVGVLHAPVIATVACDCNACGRGGAIRMQCMHVLCHCGSQHVTTRVLKFRQLGSCTRYWTLSNCALGLWPR